MYTINKILKKYKYGQVLCHLIHIILPNAKKDEGIKIVE